MSQSQPCLIEVTLITAQGSAKWPSRDELAKAAHPGEPSTNGDLRPRSLYGKTAGLLVSQT